MIRNDRGGAPHQDPAATNADTSRQEGTEQYEGIPADDLDALFELDGAADRREIDLAAGDGRGLPPRVRRMWRDAYERNKGDSEARRTRVLAHPDLRARLRAAPLRMTDLARWSGWVPPRTLPEQPCAGCRWGRPCRGEHLARINDSPWRRALVEIAAEALRRERAG